MVGFLFDYFGALLVDCFICVALICFVVWDCCVCLAVCCWFAALLGLLFNNIETISLFLLVAIVMI